MTGNNFYTTETYDKEHIHFGGKLSFGDFCTDYPQSSGEHIEDIMRDLKFDEQCRKNALARDRNPIKKEK